MFKISHVFLHNMYFLGLLQKLCSLSLTKVVHYKVKQPHQPNSKKNLQIVLSVMIVIYFRFDAKFKLEIRKLIGFLNKFVMDKLCQSLQDSGPQKFLEFFSKII